jgi:hypothetical protein
MSEARKRNSTGHEREAAESLHRQRFPDAKLVEMQVQAYRDGLVDEVCLKCNTTFLACHHFVRCNEADCPMKGNQFEKLAASIFQLEEIKDDRNPKDDRNEFPPLDIKCDHKAGSEYFCKECRPDEFLPEVLVTCSSEPFTGPQTVEEATAFHHGFIAGLTAYARQIKHSTLKTDNCILADLMTEQGWKTIEIFERLTGKKV